MIELPRASMRQGIRPHRIYAGELETGSGRFEAHQFRLEFAA